MPLLFSACPKPPPVRQLVLAHCKLTNTFLTRFFRTLCIFGLALVGVFYPYNRGALFTALVVLYALTSGVAGYVSASYYKQLEGTAWVSIKSFCTEMGLIP